MKWALKVTAIFVGMVCIMALVLFAMPSPEYKVYDCSMAEFHPDFPPDVREECRKLRTNKKYITV